MKTILKMIRNIRILCYLIRYWSLLSEYPARKAVKEARYELGYDDIGEWF